MNIKAHMICHTHWDREWYLTKEEFRTKLVRLIDGLLEIIENVPEYVSFMLDGQTIAIEDYLEIKPYNKEKLFAALKSGKIICGPWYILPDELLISGEAHIRNYIKGAEVVKEAGGKMETAYLPDSFGHPSQMPQIVEGLGMNAMVFWRGVSNAVDKTEFCWQSPYKDSRILCVHMPHGYGNSGNLSGDMNVTLPRVKKMLDSLGAKSTTNIVLLMNGSDHIIGQKDICEIVEQLNEQLMGCCIELSTMERFLSELRENLGELPSFIGEFRSGERSMLLGGTLSTRMYLKQKNDIVQNKIERYLEPLLAIEKLCGQETDSYGYLDYIWKKILENHPHDSICGCSIDEVHREMMTRYACIEQLEDIMMQDAVGRSEEKIKAKKQERKACVFLFEPTTRKLPSYLEMEISLDEILVQEVNYATSVIGNYENRINHPQMPSGIRITDERGREIPHVILETKKDYVTLYQDHTMPEIYKANKIRTGLLLPGFTYGCHQLFIEPVKAPSERKHQSEEPVIENEFYRLKAEGNKLILLEKRTNKVYDGFAKLIDKGDAGDEYTYSWPEHDTEYTIDGGNLEVTKETLRGISQSLILKGNLMLPKAVTKDRRSRKKEKVQCPFVMKFTLCKGINRIVCHMEFENRAKDHKLQVQFPSGIKTEFSESYDIFNVTQRPVEAAVPEEWMEYPQSAHPTHGYIGVNNGEAGMGVGVFGLTEYEAVQLEKETAVNVTLLRCVGWLSRTDLLTRHGNGGWTIETKEAQCLGTHTFDFCVVYHGENRQEAFESIEKFRYPSYVHPMRSKVQNQWISEEVGSLINTLPEGIELSAFKISENQKGIVLRIYSIGIERKEIRIPVPKRVSKVSFADMTEEVQKELDIQNGRVVFSVCPNQIITLYMEL